MRMIMSEEKLKELTIISTSDLNIKFPAKNPHISNEEAEKTREVIKSESAYTNDAQVLINKNALPQILATDKKGANNFYEDLENDDKEQNGKNQYAHLEAVQEEVSKRIQEPRDTLKRERLKDSEQCLIAVRDAPELEKIREVDESKIRKELPKLKERKIEEESLTTDQLTGKPLEKNAAAHHIERKSDAPRKSLKLDNIIVVNPDTHDEIHKNDAESEENLKQLCKEKGWDYPKSK